MPCTLYTDTLQFAPATTHLRIEMITEIFCSKPTNRIP